MAVPFKKGILMKRSDRGKSNGPGRQLLRLSAYAVGSLALSRGNAGAVVVFTDLSGNPATVLGGPFDLDLNLDGIVDFQLQRHTQVRNVTNCWPTTYSSTCRRVRVYRTSSATIVALNNNAISAANGIANNLPAGVPISEATHTHAILYRVESESFPTQDGVHWEVTYRSSGAFRLGSGWVGLMFDIPGSGRHAGWAEIYIGILAWEDGFQLQGFAFESDPDQSISAGDTGTTPSVAGDNNRDGVVNLDDLNHVRNHFGDAGFPGSLAGDVFPFDGIVDLNDLNAVRNNFDATSGASPVPEPPSLVLLAAGAAGLVVFRRKRLSTDSA